MPDLKNLVETELVPQHWVSSRLTERRQWEEKGQRREKLYF
jgi:hypothetical protein